MESADTTLQQLMFSLIEVWRASGKSQREFCEEKDIAYSKFHYWLKRYKVHKPGANINSGFMAVTVKDEVIARARSFELVYPDGRRLIFHQDVDPSFLRALLA